MKKWKMAVAVLLAVAAGLCGCRWKEEEAQEQEDERVTLTLYDKNAGNMKFDDRIAKAIMEETGLNIQIINTPENSTDQENLMLVQKNYPDVMLVEIENVNKFTESGAFLDLSPLIEAYAPNITAMYGNTLDELRNEDGAIYYLANWYGVDTDAVTAFQVRYDYLIQLVGKERADSDEPYTQEEFLELLRRFKETYPKVGGEESIAFTVNPDVGYQAALQGMYGLKKYYETPEGLKYLVRAPQYYQMLSFLNQMYRESLLDKEWVVNNTGYYNEKLLSGRVFATAGAYWDLDSVNAGLDKEYGEEAVFYSIKVLGEGVAADETTYGGRNSLGWDAIGITENCENPREAIEFLDFLASERGQYLQLWGIEGEDWEYVDGVRTPNPDMIAGFREDYQGMVKKTGIRKWLWCIKNGNGEDGTPYDVTSKYDVPKTVEIANRRMLTDYWDSAEYQNLEPQSGKEQALMYENIETILKRNFPRIVNAETEQEFASMYQSTMQELEAEGLAEVEQIINDNYQRVKMEE